jgi:6-phosphogluconate dehydrogenase
MEGNLRKNFLYVIFLWKPDIQKDYAHIFFMIWKSTSVIRSRKMNKIRQHNDQKKKNRKLKIEQYDPTKNRWSNYAQDNNLHY